MYLRNPMDTTKLCPVCDDTGWKTIGAGRDRRVTRCDCRRQERNQKLLEQARIPKRYEHCELSNFEIMNGHAPSLASALMAAQRFVAGYPVEKAGLLIIGPIGVGKTHLSVGILKELVVAKGIPCLFYDYRELLKEIQNSYNAPSPSPRCRSCAPSSIPRCSCSTNSAPSSPPNGCGTPSATFSIPAITTSAPPSSPPTSRTFRPPRADADDGERARAFRASREETLGDRIGERMRSRLHEMCKVVKMEGEDFRTKYRSASFR